MDFKKLVKEKELKMERLYIQLAGETSHPGLKNVFETLAKMEGEHAEQFEGMAAKEKSDVKVALDPKDMPTLQKIVTKIKKNSEGASLSISDTQKNLYKIIRDFEKDNEVYFKDLASKCDDQEMKKLLLNFSLEEGEHFKIMDDLYQLLCEPSQEIEDAEFHKTKEY